MASGVMPEEVEEEVKVVVEIEELVKVKPDNEPGV